MDRNEVWTALRAIFADKTGGRETPLDTHGATIQAASGVAFEAVVATRQIGGEAEIDAEHRHVADYADAAALYGFAIGYQLAREELGAD